MFGRFLPKETNFFDFFEKHAAIMVEASQELLKLMSTSESDPNAHAKRIKALEHEADTITHSCVEALHKTFITPLEREDIFRLMFRMDDIIDYIDAASERVVLYRLKQMTEEAKELAEVFYQSTVEVEKAVQGLRTLKNIKEMREKLININHLENSADAILSRALGRLFDNEEDTRLIIKWKEVYEILEEGVDRCEDVANIIEGIILEHD